MDPQDNTYRILSEALREVLYRPELAAELELSATEQQAIEKLNFNPEIINSEIAKGIAEEIKLILQVLREKSVVATFFKTDMPVEKPYENKADRDFLLESFRQLRSAYWTSMVMSVSMFVIGIAFLVIAAIRSFTDPQGVTMTSVIGGIGVVQMVTLFYRNPLSHIARTVSNAQQAKMAVLSYLLGITLLNQQITDNPKDAAHLNNLIHLTESALEQLQTYAESSSKAKTTTTQSPPSGQLVENK